MCWIVKTIFKPPTTAILLCINGCDYLLELLYMNMITLFSVGYNSLSNISRPDLKSYSFIMFDCLFLFLIQNVKICIMLFSMLTIQLRVCLWSHFLK